MNAEANELRRVAIHVCDGCLERRPGECHMPGCLFWMCCDYEIPDLRGVHEILGTASAETAGAA